MDWQAPTAALAGIIGVAGIGVCYFFVLHSPTHQHDLPSSPGLIAGAPTQAPDLDATSLVEPELEAGNDNAPDLPESRVAGADRDVPAPRNTAARNTVTGLGRASAAFGGKQGPALGLVKPKSARIIDHQNAVITRVQLNRLKEKLAISANQESKWKAFANALQKSGLLDTDESLAADTSRGTFTDVKTPALLLVRSLSDSQMKGASELSSLLGFKTVSAMVEAANVSNAAAVAEDQVASRAEATPARPPPSQLPTPVDHRYDGLLTKAEIGRIKSSLKLTAQQESLWPPVGTILQEVGRQQMAQLDAGQQVDHGMSGDIAQRFYYAAQPLLQTLTDEQKAEVRRRARVMGLGEYAAYL